ncbi:hypothetical protein L4D09_07295 [Photobacterium makurazakiensis]|uniref:hypothetical protein n=1 Tax=Photobacterium makurazakiensis TaxID=2910234 RepID=UPI003D0EC5DD
MKINKITLTLLAVFIGFSTQGLASGKYDKDDDESYYSGQGTNSGKGNSGKGHKYGYGSYDEYENDDSYGDSSDSDYSSSGGDGYGNSGGSDYSQSDDGYGYGNSGGSDYSSSGGDGYGNSGGSGYSHSGGGGYGDSGDSDYSHSGGGYGDSGGSDYSHSGGGYGNSDDSDYSHSDDSYGDEEDTSKRLAVRLIGSGDMYEGEVPDIDGDKYPDPAICFDVDVQNIADGEVIGSATDCLSEVTPDGEGLKLIGTTFFYLPDGLVVTRGLTTVQPVLQDTVTPEGQSITHITGASSDQNSVIKTSGDYWWHKGTARLSGMVDMSGFGGGVGDPIYFDCLFIIDLEKMKKPTYWKNWYRHHYYKDRRYDDRKDDNKQYDRYESYSSKSDDGHSYQSSTSTHYYSSSSNSSGY